MEEPVRFTHRLRDIGGKDYAAYQALMGKHDYSHFSLFVNQVPENPYRQNEGSGILKDAVSVAKGRLCRKE